MSKLPPGDQTVELLVVTHVDTDHVEGIIRLMAMPEQDWPIYVKEVWFNGWRHIEEARDRWNTRFHGNAVICGALDDDKVTLDGEMKLTILSPDSGALAALLKDWKKKLDEWELDPGDLEGAWEQLVGETKFHPDAELTLGPDDLTDKLRKLLKGIDPSTANGSSIGFIAEFGKKSCIFLGDAHMKVVCDSLKRLGYAKDKPLVVNAVKVSHHGSKNNITKEFLELVDAEHWLFSSNGDKHKHPDKEAVEAVIQGATRTPTLWFNYRSAFTKIWEKDSQPNANYFTKYPEEGKEGIGIQL